MIDFSKVTSDNSVSVDELPGCSVRKDAGNAYTFCGTKGTFFIRVTVYSLMLTYEITNIATADVKSSQQASINTLCQSLTDIGYTKDEVFTLVDLINSAIHYLQEHSMDYVYARNADKNY